MVLLYAGSLCHAQYVGTAAGTPAGGPINNAVAGHWFQQRGNGTANVAVNYDFVSIPNTFQDSPALRVHGKPFSVAFWYRSTQTGPFRLLWENGEVFGNTGYVVGLHNGYIAFEELNGDPACPFTTHPDWLHGSTATNDGNWHHAAVVADRDNAHTYVYKDGVRDDDGTLAYCDPADNISSPSNQWYGIGRNSSDYDFAGDVEHFTSWAGVALTADEVKYHMNGGMPQYGNVGVWYEFENAVGQRVPDLGPNHYDGHVSFFSSDANPLLGPGPAFQAYVVDPDGVPMPRVEIVFTAPATGPSGTFINGLRTVKVTTDPNGIATAPLFTANGIPGSYTVNAKMESITAPARFSVTNRVSITASAGTPQSTTVQTPFTYPLQVAVTDPNNLNPMPNLTVTFKAPTTGAFATFPGGLATVTAVTNASGLATSPGLTANNVAGAFTVTATVTGGSANFSLANSTATTTALSSSVNPSAYKQSITLTVNVTAPASNLPSGTAYIDDTTLGTRVATITVTKGVGSYKTSALAVGVHYLQAAFTDGAGFTPSVSPALIQGVSQASSTVSLKSSRAPSVFQQSVTITATVTPQFGTATGTVTFLDGSTVVAGPVALASGKASFSTSTLTVGSHSITAVYSGDANVTGSTSPAFIQTVNQAPSKVTLAASPNPAAVGQSVTLTATVVGVPSGAVRPTGTVTFTLPGNTVLGSVAVNSSGKAKLTLTTLPAGSNVITATYGGDSNFTGNFGTVTEVVQ